MENALARAVKLCHSGRYAEAQSLCSEILKKQPHTLPAVQLLAEVANRSGDPQSAIPFLERAIESAPKEASLHFHLGDAQRKLFRWDKAESSYRQVVHIVPDCAAAYVNLGLSLAEQRKYHEAARQYQTAIEYQPDLAIAHRNLAATYLELGKIEQAETACREAIRLDPDSAEAHFNLASIYQRQSQWAAATDSLQRAVRLAPDLDEAYRALGYVDSQQQNLEAAIAAYRKAISLQPDKASYHAELGGVFLQAGRLAEAEESLSQALASDPASIAALQNSGNLFRQREQYDQAIDCYQRALAQQPDNAFLLNNLASVLLRSLRLSEAEQTLEKALLLEPWQAPIWNNMATLRRHQGRVVEAVAGYRRALEIDPDYAEAHSSLLFCLNHLESYSAEDIFAEHVAWGDRFCQPAKFAQVRPAGSQAMRPSHGSKRKIRVGYVSPDFRKHVVASFIEPILTHHNRNEFEVTCYAEVAAPDEVTTRLKSQADNWCSTVGLSDMQLAEKIRTDKIDILIDLAGHTANSRLRVFGSHPAPIAITYLGYPNTTGLPAIDYRLTDQWADPPENNALHTEQLIRLPSGFLCYLPPGDAPDVASPPILENGYPTFGSFNRLEKIGPETILLWASLLKRVPSGRLLLKTPALDDEETCQRYFALFEQQGIARERLQLHGFIESSAGHFDAYSRIDIALDPFPYNGTTTSCEALWMGVPVVTLSGRRHAGRVGMSLAHQIDRTDWIARSKNEYVRIAARLANDPEYLSSERFALRTRMQATTLCDGVRFTRELEDTFRRLFREWSAGKLCPAGGYRLAQQNQEQKPNSQSAPDANRADTPQIIEETRQSSTSEESHAVQTALARCYQLLEQEKFEEAIASYTEAAKNYPHDPRAHHGLAIALRKAGRAEKALASYRKASELAPEDAEIMNNLGNALRDLGRLTEAEQAFRAAIARSPALAASYSNLAAVLRERGEVNTAVENYKKALDCGPNKPETYSDYLFTLQHVPGLSGQQLLGEHEKYADQLNLPCSETIASERKFHDCPRAVSRDADRRLRIGYVSPDLREHVVARFLLPILRHYDRQAFEVVAYSNHHCADKISNEIAGLVDAWREIYSLPDELVREQIAQDEIDILIDLAGHTVGNRLPLFATRNAPVQATYLGYPGTTGLSSIDYRLTDAWADPPKYDRDFSESIYRIAGGFLCCQPPENLPEVNRLPAIKNDTITFGSLNRLSKIHRGVVRLWARLMGEVPRSRMIIKAVGFADCSVQQQYQQWFAEEGISPERLDLRGPTESLLDHCRTYHQIDIGLDPFPYCGTATSCDALWMGVPVITMTSATHASRVGASLLSSLGLKQCIATSEQQYIQAAIQLSANIEKLAEIRSSLRLRIGRVNLGDPAQFVVPYEKALRAMWKKYCDAAAKG